MCPLSAVNLRSHRLRAPSPKTAPLHKSLATSTSDQPVINWGVLTISPPDARTLGIGHYEGYSEQPDEEVHRVRSRRVLSTGASVSMDLGYLTFLDVDEFTKVDGL